jgi:hypothetical protein
MILLHLANAKDSTDAIRDQPKSDNFSPERDKKTPPVSV